MYTANTMRCSPAKCSKSCMTHTPPDVSQQGVSSAPSHTGSSLKRRNWSRRGCGRCDRFSGRFRRVQGARHPQPGSRRGARSAARTNGLDVGEDDAILVLAGSGRGSMRYVVLGFRLMVVEDQSEAGRGSAASHPFAARGGMRRCGSSGAGSIKGATTPPQWVGVMTPAITRPAGFQPAHAAPLANARISPSRRP